MTQGKQMWTLVWCSDAAACIFCVSRPSVLPWTANKQQLRTDEKAKLSNFSSRNCVATPSLTAPLSLPLFPCLWLKWRDAGAAKKEPRRSNPGPRSRGCQATQCLSRLFHRSTAEPTKWRCKFAALHGERSSELQFYLSINDLLLTTRQSIA